MTPIFSLPAAATPYAVRRQSKAIANQRLPTIPEENPLTTKRKRGNMHIEKAVELRFIVPQVEVGEILNHKEGQRTGTDNIYLSVSEGKKLWKLFYRNRQSKRRGRFITCPNKTVIIFQNMQVQFIVPHIEEEHKTLRASKETISLEISEVEKLWSVFSKDQVMSPALNDPIVIPDGTLMRVQNRQNDNSTSATEPRPFRISHLFTRCFPCGK